MCEKEGSCEEEDTSRSVQRTCALGGLVLMREKEGSCEDEDTSRSV